MLFPRESEGIPVLMGTSLGGGECCRGQRPLSSFQFVTNAARSSIFSDDKYTANMQRRKLQPCNIMQVSVLLFTVPREQPSISCLS